MALVTGGAGGIGGAVVRALAKAGVAGVVVNYRKSSKEAEALAAEIERGGVKALAVQADVQSDAQVRAMMQTIEDQLRPARYCRQQRRRDPLGQAAGSRRAHRSDLG